MSDETLFLEYLEAVERGDTPDVSALCARAQDPLKLRKNIDLHGSLGTTIGRFRVLERLGHGGFGTVFLAQDPKLGRRVAIKLMGGSDWARNEARSLARLRHPNIVEVHEVEDDYVVMEYVDGEPLTPRGAPNERLRTLLKIADAVAYSHEEGVLSRDIKPDNVLVTKDGDVKLIDFSIAHVEGDDTDLDITRSLVASPAYLAPEQIESGTTGASEHSDQFSLAVLSYEYLTGTHPFRKPNATRQQVLNAIARCAAVRPPGLARDLQNVLLKALDPEPRKRYPSVRAFRDDIEAVLELRPVSVSGFNPMRWVRRNRGLLSSAAAVVLLIGGVLGWQHYRRLADLRAMPMDTALDCMRVIGVLAQVPDDLTEDLLVDRFGVVKATDDWCIVGWLFYAATGRLSPIENGQVFAPDDAVFERLLPTGTYEVIDYTGELPLAAGYYRCNGVEFRKVGTWDPAIRIERIEPDTSGAVWRNGVFATDPIRDEKGNVLAVSLDRAMAYAREKGGRLPRVADLRRMGIVDGPAAGEWIGDFHIDVDSDGNPYFGDAPGAGLIDSDSYYHYWLAEQYLAREDAEKLENAYFTAAMFLGDNSPYVPEEGVELPSACFRIVFDTQEKE